MKMQWKGWVWGAASEGRATTRIEGAPTRAASRWICGACPERVNVTVTVVRISQIKAQQRTYSTPFFQKLQPAEVVSRKNIKNPQKK